MTENTKLCPYCGSEILESVKKCKYCGEWLVIQEKDKPKTSLHLGLILEVLIGILSIPVGIHFGADSAISFIIAAYIALNLYFLPTLIADGKRTQYTVAIFALDLFLGWTIIGWIGSLIWALTLPNLSKNIEKTAIAQKKITEKEPQTERTEIINLTNNVDIPHNIKQWNWGAFWLTWIWGFGNRSFKTLWALIPYFGFIWMFVCGVKGNEWAWKNKQWSNVEDFNNTQRKWAITGNILIALLLILSLACYTITQNISNKPVNNGQTTVQEEINSDIEEHGDIIDNYYDPDPINGNSNFEESVEQVISVQKEHVQKQIAPKANEQKVTPVQTTPQPKPVPTQQQNQDIDDFMN